MDSNRGVRGGDDFLISRGSFENQENDASNLESGDRRISIQSNDWENADISLPLLIVGNKIDKLSATEKLALQTACPQQVFVVNK